MTVDLSGSDVQPVDGGMASRSRRRELMSSLVKTLRKLKFDRARTDEELGAGSGSFRHAVAAHSA
jgi:hypothetical protein